ncbi:cryptochrome/photolyase family protein [Labilibacter marinus]|uniref:cryptochrome/photolyase family protein n=1 Tax=Labilibacter marinus TaxID=1477105 RepID=UPI000835063F|nr:deoxyribodipyrimidine photo-lyase [Labilibacter marinus]
MTKKKVNIVWLRRDLRLVHNTALKQAAREKLPVLLLFIFDENIVNQLPENDSRISFIYQQLERIHLELRSQNRSLLIKKGNPLDIISCLLQEYNVPSIFANEDYEPYAIKRDNEISELSISFNSKLHLFKDQVIFAKSEIVKKDQSPYTVYTPYKNQWLNNFEVQILDEEYDIKAEYINENFHFPSLTSLGFKAGRHLVKDYNLDCLGVYEEQRDYPIKDIGSYIGPHLRFGTVSIRQIAKAASEHSKIFLNELIWREFFMQIMFHFPHSITESFKPQYKFIPWHNNENDFKLWCEGKTGFPMVDAGMRQLNSTGYMHNRVRMITASFLCKHLLIDWRWGETYFASKLLDYELSSNIGNWQWAASTGCDAVPYFRIFNPELQQKRFDPTFEYIKKWIPEYGTNQYPKPMVDHKTARERAISTYKTAIIK